ncbi:MAG: hypothetical protein FIA90_02990 [candidate division NC10 bacterium]|nr:hypothetical protein [candidate division NC10 bacterium]
MLLSRTVRHVRKAVHAVASGVRRRPALLTAVLPAAVLAGTAAWLSPLQAAQGMIKTITPRAAYIGDQARIKGHGFGAHNVQITVGGIAAPVLSATGHSAVFLVPPGLHPGPTTVTVTNPGGRSGSIAFTILNHPPLANAGLDQTVSVATTVQLDGTASSDLDGDPLTFHWTFVSVPTGSTATLSDPTVVRPTILIDRPGTYAVQLLVNDGYTDSSPDTVQISTTNSRPVGDAGLDQTVHIGSLVQLDGSLSSDVDGDPLTYGWTFVSAPTGSQATLSDATTAYPSFVADLQGRYIVQFIANDGALDSKPATVQIDTTNSRPTADAGHDQQATIGDPIQLDGTASFDIDDDPLTYRWSFTTAPTDSAARLLNPTTVQPRFVPDLLGDYVAQLIVNDGFEDSLPDTVAVTVAPSPNRPPIAGDDTAVTDANASISIAVLGNDGDPDGDSLTITAVMQGSQGGTVTLNGVTVTYTSPTNWSGTDSFTYTISDGRGGTATASVTVTVNAVLPTITGFTPTSGEVGDSVTITGTNLGSVRSVTFNEVRAGIDGSTSTSIRTVVPIGAATGRITVETAGGAATSGDDFVVLLSQDFALSVSPPSGAVVQGTSTTYMVRLASTGAHQFTGLASPSLEGLPQGATASFSPALLATGQTATLRVNAASTTPVGIVPLTIVAVASIDGRPVTRSASASLAVVGAGITALAGRVLDTDEQPIQGVTLRIETAQGSIEAVTDAGGNFLMQNPPVGDQVVLIDGQTASTSTKHYPTIPTNVTILSGVVNQLPFIPHLHLQKNFNFTQISPTQETIASDPELPGVALRIPAGTQIIGWDGQPNDKVSIRTVPIDRLPIKPPPPEVRARTVYMFYFGKQGGGTPSRPIPFAAPNDLGLAPGEKAELWYFDESRNPGEAPNDWRIAGTGTVSADGKTIVTDSGVGIPKFCCGASLFSSPSPDGTPINIIGQSPQGGDPVDLATGAFVLRNTDLVLPARIPIVIERTYRTMDTVRGPFGSGTYLGYNWLVRRTVDAATLILPGNSRIAFSRQPDGTFTNGDQPLFLGAKLVFNVDGSSILHLKNGAFYTFSSAGILVEQADHNGNKVTIKREFASDATRVIAPDGREFRLQMREGFPNLITRITDPLGRAATYEYSGGQLISATNPDGGVTSYTYDGSSRMTAITDPKGITFLRNTYDVNSRVCEQQQADGGTFRFYYITADQASLPESAQLLQEAAGGGPISVPPCSAQPSTGIVGATVVIDPLGRPTTYRFNGAGYLTSQTDAVGQTTRMEREEGTNLLLATTDPVGRTTRVTYDDSGNVRSITDPAGQTRSFEYEPTFSRLTRLTDPMGNVTTFAYDGLGNLTSLTDPTGASTRIAYNEFGQPISTTDPLGHVTRFEYDLVGNLATITDPLGYTTQRTYDLVSRLLTQTDPRGRTTSLSYDTLNRLTQLVDAVNGLTRFTYDGNGNLLTVTDAQNHTITHTYDDMDHLASRTDAVGAVESFTYDGNGNLTSTTDRKGQASTFTYDALNRRTKSSFADGSSTSFTYDAAGRLLQAGDSIGGTILHEYDTLDRLTTQITNLGAIHYAYDALGRRTQMQVGDLSPVSYTYDAASRLRTITQAPLNPASIDYDTLGRRTNLTLPNGGSTEYQYDAASRLTALIYRNAAGLLGDLTYTYDPAGNRIGVGGLFARTLLPDSITAGTYDPANRQQSFGDKTMTYDANGNLTSITDPNGLATFTWDARNRLVGLAGPDATASFVYDAFGRRVVKQINGSATQYLYDGLDITQEVRPSGPISYLRTLTIDEVLGSLRQDGAYFSIYDGLGSTLSVMDQTSNPAVQYAYDPFGTTSSTNPAFSNPFQYTRRENDDTGLYFYRARYYHPGLARFISEDPLGFRDGLNEYTYVRNNPTNASDPLGLLTVMVHGVRLGAPRPGTYAENPLGRAIREAGERVEEVRWNGNPLSVQAQTAVLNKIADYAAQAAARGEPFNIIGHSWGSGLAVDYNVSTLLAGGQSVDLLVTMGSPVMGGDTGFAKDWVNIWSPLDPISWPSALTLGAAQQVRTWAGHMGYWEDPTTINEIVRRIAQQRGRQK